ncbi:hypothetical protein FA95DRAFT_1597829 [Auriscalpium vulgare]|uniref:Uncharacterized protein n=1 Tax=Auriscalpium vulgare TaxID=40419 RepID=A0ACB8RHU7_9AGAM|nr:hypothetical protein FA95DRAFT_1597829 [Auriscalpium vulgare]
MTSAPFERAPPLSPNFLDTLGSLENEENVVAWINEVLDVDEGTPSGADLNAMDKQVSQLIASLDVASEDLSLQLEHLIDDVSRSSSRLPYDLHFMRDSAFSLQGALNALTSRSDSSFSAESSQALATLHNLDTIKAHMETARDVLREAESWSTLESEVSSLLSEQSYEKAAEKLSEANKSVVVFQNTSDYEHRRALMVSLQNQLEASLSSALIAAINSHDLAVCRNYYTIFCNIQRDSEFRTYYHGSRRSGLISMWQDISLTDVGDPVPSPGTSPAQPFATFLSTFFTSFLATLNTERTSISAIFPDPQTTLSTFITSTLSSLQPTFAQRLSALSNHLGPSSLIELIAAFQVTEKFAVAADKILERTERSTANALLSPPESAAATPETTPLSRQNSRRKSNRMSISRRMSMSYTNKSFAASGSGLDWEQDLFEPFLEFQVEYSTLEKRLLKASLQNMAGDASTSDQARLLRERSVDVFSLAESSLERVLSFTHGYGVLGLIRAVDEFFQTFISSSQTALANTGAAGRQLPSSSSGENVTDLDYTDDDWSEIQTWLHLLESLRTVLERENLFEVKLRAVLLQVAASFRSMEQDLLGTAYIPGTTRGEVQLLTQSVLNSADLHALLKEHEPESRAPSQDNIPRPSASRTTSGVQKGVLLSQSRAAVAAFTTMCQTSLQAAMLAPLRRYLDSYDSLPLWTAHPSDSRQRRTGASATSEAQVPTFSLSPSDIMQHVAEGLLNLPRLFEVYAADDVLAFSMETLPCVDMELLDSLVEAPREPQPMHARRQSMSVKAQVPTTLPQRESFSPEAIESVWLSSLGRSLVEHLTATVLPKIRSLTAAGAAQLVSDLGYLSNIIGALNVESEALEKWKDAAALDEERGVKKLSEGANDPSLVQVAKMRGWAAVM